MQKLKFLIVDDQKIIRESLAEKIRFILADAQILDTGSGKESISIAKVFRPDIVFMDISMPEMDGIEATRLILSELPSQKIIAFSMNDNDEMLNKMMNAGAKGYLLKTDDLEDYQVAIDTVLSGQIFISKNVIK